MYVQIPSGPPFLYCTLTLAACCQKLMNSDYFVMFTTLIAFVLSSDDFDFEIQIQGYNIVRLDRNRHGGGVIIFIVFVKARKGWSSLMALGVLYRPPSSCVSLFDTLFSVICNCLYFWSRDFQPIGCVEKCAINHVKHT